MSEHKEGDLLLMPSWTDIEDPVLGIITQAVKKEEVNGYYTVRWMFPKGDRVILLGGDEIQKYKNVLDEYRSKKVAIL